MVTDRFPNHKSEEVIKSFLQTDKLPDLIKKWETYIVPEGPNGIKAYNLIKVDRGDADDAYIEISRIMNSITNMEGRSWQIEPLLGITDAMKTFKLH